MGEKEIIRRDLEDYAVDIKNRVESKLVKVPHDLIFHQIKTYLDGKSAIGILKNYSLRWFNSHTIIVALNMSAPINGNYGYSFSVDFPHLENCTGLIDKFNAYDRAMKGV